MGGKWTRANFTDYKPLREIIFDTLRKLSFQGTEAGERLMEVQLAERWASAGHRQGGIRKLGGRPC